MSKLLSKEQLTEIEKRIQDAPPINSDVLSVIESAIRFANRAFADIPALLVHCRVLETDLRDAKKWIADIEEREAAVCPEDVPFDEHIRALEVETLKGICVYCGTVEQYESLEQKSGEVGNLMRINHILQCSQRPESKLIELIQQFIDIGRHYAVDLSDDVENALEMKTPEQALRLIKGTLQMGVERNNELNETTARLCEVEAERNRLYELRVENNDQVAVERQADINKAIEVFRQQAIEAMRAKASECEKGSEAASKNDRAMRLAVQAGAFEDAAAFIESLPATSKEVGHE